MDADRSAAGGALPSRPDLTFAGNRNQPRHDWLRLTPAYSRRVVESLLDRADPAVRVLDPFSGSGTTVQQVNKVLKMHQEMAGAMKKIRKMGGLKGLGALFGKGGGIPGMGGGMGGMPGLGGGGSIPPELANFMNKKK